MRLDSGILWTHSHGEGEGRQIVVIVTYCCHCSFGACPHGSHNNDDDDDDGGGGGDTVFVLVFLDPF